jgi:hypothetical protein
VKNIFFVPIKSVWATVRSATFHTVITPTGCDQRRVSDKIMTLLRWNSQWLVGGKWRQTVQISGCMTGILNVVEITNIKHWFLPLLYSIYWLLHVSAVVCHHQGASWIRLSYLKYRCLVIWAVCRSPAHSPHNHTLYDIPPTRSVFQVNRTDSRRSLMMADYCRNVWKPVYRIKEWHKSVHNVGYFYYV